MSSTNEQSDALSSEQRLKAILKVEAALAGALAKSGIISQEQAIAITEACRTGLFNAQELESQGAIAGTPVIPLVKALVSQTHPLSESASHFVHFGATSQDILDTATVLQLREVLQSIYQNLSQIDSEFTSLAVLHERTPLLGRTLLQAGPPISFGLKVAGWAAAIRRGKIRIEETAQQSLCLQFGGAVGNLSSLSSKGPEVSQNLADELDLPLADAPWHTHRDRLVNLASSVGILMGSLAKIARDISLHMQGEIGELREPSKPGNGGSSAMPHKRNPVGCMHILAAANRTPALVSSLLSGMPQEHERGLGGWQSEWPSLKELFSTALEASSAMTEIAEGLEVDAGRMRTNLDATQEVVFSERLSGALLPKLGRVEAQDLVEILVNQSIDQNRTLSQVVAENTVVQSILDTDALVTVFDIQQALGSSSVFMERLLNKEDS
ncbi:3-carboxy-cis,cis-muconate cycloisomerase [Opitutia bacterium ISCC 51]|nr:3-carboxy-cis,cis-muconate cycloisomerase [Opitutae bacterium ISCC 51]QXD29764.1 3-carboxy-cis,cis-muconate cycloisomerase [Opitutae bacterium ISCC 52]